jgi:ABC-type Fe3+/spermidine/putrescine transport system ATPase subunit|tara:strand:- start:583 stop:798 length:216 start_codon:yes stop_codon:yes gene_type:complete
MKLNKKQKTYLMSIVDNCHDKTDFIRVWYNDSDSHYEAMEKLGKPHELLESEQEMFITDYWNQTKFLNSQF